MRVSPTPKSYRLAGFVAASLLAMACSDAESAAGRVPAVQAPSGIWLKGDLHLHSAHSTDALDNPVDAVIARAESVGMDYFTFTDHDNHVEGNIATWADPSYASEHMLMLFGVEYTTARAHVNFFSSAPWDHLALWALRDGEAQPYLDEAHRQGLHASINHPFNADPWEHSFELDFDSIEVWNALSALPGNSATLEKWDELSSNGRRIAGRGGSDVHHQEGLESMILNVGNPTTWIRARERTGAAVLEALKAGHVSISYAPAAERIDFTADADGDRTYEAVIGSNIASRGSPIEFRIEIVGFRPGAAYNVTVIKNGAILQELALDRASATFIDAPAAGARAYYRLEVRGETPEAPTAYLSLYGGLIAITNPIYVGYE
jgi:hypothetical protein